MAIRQSGPNIAPKHLEGYASLRDSAASVILERSLIGIEGKETFDFLHRMSTNDLLTLADGQTRRTVIVNEKGRVIDFVTIVRTGERALLIGSPGAGNELARWFGKFIIMDDLRITATHDRIPFYSIYGPGSPDLIRKICAEGGAGKFHDDRVLDAPGNRGWILREDLGSVPGYLYIPGEDCTMENTAPMFRWSEEEIRTADTLTFETVRIEESVPALGRELGPEVNALEAGLKQYISFSKGCYIGQEVIARLDTYRKLQKILSLFLLPDYDGPSLSPGKLLQGDREAGRITSTVYSPRQNGWIGLGYRRIEMKDPMLDFIPEGVGRSLPCRCLSGLPAGYEEYEVQE
ncbi:MAG TPA: hypothetical protein VI932_00360 [Bacteroidota bacterium]|nr:hypothetical protein [Bacteroidota bacterium]